MSAQQQYLQKFTDDDYTQLKKETESAVSNSLFARLNQHVLSECIDWMLFRNSDVSIVLYICLYVFL